MVDLKEIQTQFTKDELLQVARELGIVVDISVMYRNILNTVINDLEENGIPEPDDCSELMLEFLYVLDYIDEEGEPILEVYVEEEEWEDGEEEESVDEEYDIEQIKKEVHCFSYADSLDPSCNRCKVFDLCMKAREELRPDCFGTYSDTDPDCAACLEMSLCKQITKERIKEHG